MLCFVSIVSYGQNVAILQDENLGDYRKIQTDYVPYAKKGLAELTFSLQYFSPVGTSQAYYTMTFHITLGAERQSLPKGSKMYLKLDDGSVLEFESINDIAEYDNTKAMYMEIVKKQAMDMQQTVYHKLSNHYHNMAY